MRKVTILLAVVAVLALAVPASAELVLVNFGDAYNSTQDPASQSVGGPDANGNIWTELLTDGNENTPPDDGAITVPMLEATTGVAIPGRTVGLSYVYGSSAIAGYSSLYDGLGTQTPTGTFATLPLSGQAVGTGISASRTAIGGGSSGSIIGITLTGLSAGVTYDIDFYNGKSNNDRNMVYSVISAGGTLPADQVVSYDDGTDTSTPNSSEVGSFSLTPDANGEIIIHATGVKDSGAATYSAFGAMQVVPEPATMVLLGLGGIGVLIRRKRR
ncbi:MAG: PEP-CTERM sorting domain-containing protein [Phycisphaerae bacterium]|nr:PEP-CTERM sorting domain-containing protein [Phycisphaerae bacterium]